MSYLKEVEKRLDMPPAEKEQVMRELASHFNELKDDLLSSGMDAGQAEIEAEHRLGDPNDVAARMNIAHCRASWNIALFAVLPVIGLIVADYFLNLAERHSLLLSWVINSVIFALLSWVVIRKLRLGLRPIWLPVWMAIYILYAKEMLLLFLLKLPLIASSSHVITIHNGSVVFGNFWEARSAADYFSLIIHNGVLVFATVALAVLASWKVPKWRRSVLELSFLLITVTVLRIAIPLYLYSWSGIVLSEIFRITQFALITISAMCLFMHHEYGHPLQASLFIYVFYSTGWLLIQPSAPDSLLNLIQPQMLIVCIVILLYARAPHWHQKLAAIVCGIVLRRGILALYMTLSHRTVSINVLAGRGQSITTILAVRDGITLLLILGAVMVPLLIARRQKQEHVEMVS